MGQQGAKGSTIASQPACLNEGNDGPPPRYCGRPLFTTMNLKLPDPDPDDWPQRVCVCVCVFACDGCRAPASAPIMHHASCC